MKVKREKKSYLLEHVNPLLDLLIFGLHQVLIVTACVPRVEGVIPDDEKCNLGKGALVVLQHSIQVLVVAPGHHQVPETAFWGVHSVFGAVR